MTGKSLKKLALPFLVILCLMGAFAIPAYASITKMTMSVASLVPGSWVGLEMANLPPFTTFTVTMGQAGSKGIGGPVVAHFTTQWGTTATRWFEIQSEVRQQLYFDVRIDDGAGNALYLTVDNTVPVSLPVITATPIPTATTAPLGWNITTRQFGLIKIVKVQRDGIVVAAVRNMPADTVFTTTIGAAGTKGIGGYPVGTLTTAANSTQTMVGTFEIPSALRGSQMLDIRVEAPGTVYYATFYNINYP